LRESGGVDQGTVERERGGKKVGLKNNKNNTEK
jgi:hypothetical protein